MAHPRSDRVNSGLRRELVQGWWDSVHPKRGGGGGFGHLHAVVGNEGVRRPTYSMSAFSFEGCSLADAFQAAGEGRFVGS